MKAAHHELVPALHSAAEQLVQRLSGLWQAYSLAFYNTSLISLNTSLMSSFSLTTPPSCVVLKKRKMNNKYH
jgi:hypothetical protein